MTRIYNFPDIPIAKQLFHVPGASQEGGFTIGGARITSPEPGGRSVLELQLSMQDTEWQAPFSSWLMSSLNGRVMRVKLAMTPQVITSINMNIPHFDTGYFVEGDRYAAQRIKSELRSTFLSGALEGNTTIDVDMRPFGPILKLGHVIGHRDNCYLVDDIFYQDNGTATIVVTPPFRRHIVPGDVALFRPFFLGTISNGDSFRTTYDAENNGMIQGGTITFNEAVV